MRREPSREPLTRARRVAVIGGGWAGCAAAVALADAGVHVALYEQARELGGRARRVTLDGLALDNGQHLIIGAYRETLGLVARVHGTHNAGSLTHRLPLTLQPFGNGWKGAVKLRAPHLPAPFHLAAALLCAGGLSWSHRLALINDFRQLTASRFMRTAGETVAECFAGIPRLAFRAVWEPLCLAALNTPPARASAQLFANVLRAAFTGTAAGSDFLIPAVDLSALLPDPCARVVQQCGGTVHLGARVRRIDRSGKAMCVSTQTEQGRFDAVIVATGPHQLHELEVADAAWSEMRRQVSAFRYESITTIYLAYSQAPAIASLARLDDAPGQWVFDRGVMPVGGDMLRVLAVVISAGGAHDAMSHPALVDQVERLLRHLAPTLGERRFARVIAERRATYACVAGLVRPAPGRVADGLHLCGDYTDPEFPATLEAAVRSGAAAARSALRELKINPTAG